MTASLILAIFRQALRSVALLLLPIAFASLIIWATAGSSTGSTSDPIFTSLWFYLAAHQIPLDIAGSLAGARLTFLPLGALVLVFFAIRSGVTRSVALFDEDRKRIVVPIFALLYSLLLLVISLFSSLRDEVVSVRIYLAIPIALLVAFAFSLIASRLMPARTRAPWEIATTWAAFALAILLAVATLVLFISLVIHYRAVLDLTTVISPGIFGGVALIAIQILYLPNMVVATLGYISGSGAHIGSGSIIHPFLFELDQLPALPLLGALPRGSFPWAIAGAFVVIAFGFIIHRRLLARVGSDLTSAISLAAFFVLSLLIAVSASGQLITDVLGEVGPSWWRFPLVLSGELALGMALSKGAIVARDRLREKLKEREEGEGQEP
ncbi:MAG: DUF6350 family protein [Actinomycetota bacterium]